MLNDRLPDFLGVGSARSGTTSLHMYLKEHPDIYIPEMKSPGFFCSGPRSSKCGALDDYMKLFAGRTNEKAAGEFSPNYMMDRQAWKKIQDRLGDIRIIIILRNPVDSVYSMWGRMRWSGGEALSFEDAVAAEEERKRERGD